MGIERFRRYTAWDDVANRRRYRAPADPWDALRVDPSAVTHLAVGPVRWGIGRVRGGERDRARNLTRVTDIPAHEGSVQRFERGAD